jgi:hypothetical protein
MARAGAVGWRERVAGCWVAVRCHAWLTGPWRGLGRPPVPAWAERARRLHSARPHPERRGDHGGPPFWAVAATRNSIKVCRQTTGQKGSRGQHFPSYLIKTYSIRTAALAYTCGNTVLEGEMPPCAACCPVCYPHQKSCLVCLQRVSREATHAVGRTTTFHSTSYRPIRGDAKSPKPVSAREFRFWRRRHQAALLGHHSQCIA